MYTPCELVHFGPVVWHTYHNIHYWRLLYFPPSVTYPHTNKQSERKQRMATLEPKVSIMTSVILAHRKASHGIREAYALYREGKKVVEWDGEVNGFNKPYLLSQAKKWCLPNEELGEVEVVDKVFPPILDVSKPPSEPKRPPRPKKAPSKPSKPKVEGEEAE